jgi:hypothetical protein
MKSSTSPSRIGLMPNSASKVKSIERMQTGTRRLNLKKREASFAETGPPLISTQRTTLLRMKHPLVAVKERRY